MHDCAMEYKECKNYGNYENNAIYNKNASSKSMFWMQIIANIVPIFANIALAIMACLQKSWMMLAMVVPSIMMYIACLIPQIIQYNVNKKSDNKNENNIKKHVETQFSKRISRQHVQGVPNTLVPINLEAILINNANQISNISNSKNIVNSSTPPWKNVVYSWLKSSNESNKKLVAPIGISENGYFCLDLIRNGPHALVAGTTGSGKSVLLTSWCLALAFNYSPKSLQFVFMDFKGGATFDALSTLPHSIGNVGDLNLQHAVRALKGLEKELDRRERLVACQGCHDINQVKPYQPSLAIVIDEFHALKNQLPDYMNRLIRIASVGRSLGMHLIACTQNPMAQVNADMKANMSINICLRVRDAMQSHELLGSSCAASINPNNPGAAYCNTGDGIIALQCSQSRNKDSLIQAIKLAGKFYYYNQPKQLFSAPLPRYLGYSTIKNYCNNTFCNNKSSRFNSDFSYDLSKEDGLLIGLKDDGINLSEAILPTNLGNIAIIGGNKRGKTNLINVISKAIKSRNTYNNSQNIYILDNADSLLEPFSSDTKSQEFQSKLVNPKITVIFCAQNARHIRIPEQAPVRIIFPTGDAGTDTMLGIPSDLLKTLNVDDYQTPGRCVMVIPGSANLLQILSFT